MPQVVFSPASTAVHVPPPETCTGSQRFVESPTPRLPQSLEPQQDSAPAVVTAQP